ncbi:MAG: helix-turn-helix protein [Bacteroidetes bacterium]|nr:helix-turn-helix protein [Bacteroidota bacterium]
MKSKLPVFNIDKFARNEGFYVNRLIPHIRDHHFIEEPHKHDFYLIVLFTKGSGEHIIDFRSYPVKPGTIFMMSPGQTHHWNLSRDIDGFVFFHTKDFYDEGFVSEKTEHYPFFSSIHNAPLLRLNLVSLKTITAIFKEMLQEYGGNEVLKLNKLHCLVNLIYIELARKYNPQQEIRSEKYLVSLKKLEELIDKNFKSIKYPYEYAEMMHLTEKHLNRISKECLGKTTSDLIAERILLEAKRLLVHSHDSVSEISDQLGFTEPSYFSRLFKKRTGSTPAQFRSDHKTAG